MVFSRILELKLDRLLDLMLTSGVQPSDLVDNIFLNEYNSISYKKHEQNIIGELVFEEKEGDIITSITMKYTYDSEKRICRIEEEVDGRTLILWDRSNTETELINDILNIMDKKYSGDEVNKFIMSLPEQLKSKINSIIINRVA